jgi:dihydrolipoamide dehydrogenase
LLGIQGVGVGTAELSAGFSSAGFSLALAMGARLEDVAATIHAHPTQSESLLDSAYMTLSVPMHV